MPYNFEDILSVLSESSLDELFNEYDFYSEGKVEDAVVNTVDKAAHSKAGKKFITAVDNAKNKPKNEKVEKAINTVKSKSGEIADKVVNSTAAEKSGKVVNDAINKTSNVVSKVIAGKRPSDMAPEVQEKYEAKVNTAKAVIKGGVVAASKLVLMGPLDWLLTASVVKGIAQSDDPSDKMIVDTYKKVSDKAKALKERLINVIDDAKKEDISDDNFTKKYDSITLQGMNYAKELDSAIIKSKKEQPVSESAVIQYAFDKYLVKEDGTLVDNAYELLSIIVEKVDYVKYDISDIIENYINMLI